MKIKRKPRYRRRRSLREWVLEGIRDYDNKRLALMNRTLSDALAKRDAEINKLKEELARCAGTKTAPKRTTK